MVCDAAAQAGLVVNITSEWGLSDNNPKAKFYQLTRAGRKQIEKETQEWEQMAAILARFLNPKVA